VLDADGDVLPGSDAAGEDAGGEDAGGEDAGGEEAGGDDAGGDDAGGDEAGGEEAGGEEAGGGDAGGEEAGGDDAGGDDAGGLPGVDACTDDWDTTGVGGIDVPDELDRAGLRYAFGETRAGAEGEAERDVGGLAAGLDDAEAGELASAPAPASGWRGPDDGVWLAPIRAKAATAEPATSAPVRHAEASVREIRCRPGPPVPSRGG
jgi:hypothetical protein